MLIIGLAGGIASGKSFVAACFQQLGAALIDADKVGHVVLEQTDVQELIAERWGPELVKDGQVDRRRLAGIVFHPGGEDDLAELEEITHPRIRTRIESRIKLLEAEGRYPAVVFDAPVMFRVGWDEVCDQVVFVDASLATRQQRGALRGWETGELERRESRQVSVEEKKRLSTCVIDNSGSEQDTRDQVQKLWQQWNLSHE